MGSCSGRMNPSALVAKNEHRESMRLRMMAGISAMAPGQAQQSSDEVHCCRLVDLLDVIS